jgi:hypothetical protein
VAAHGGALGVDVEPLRVVLAREGHDLVGADAHGAGLDDLAGAELGKLHGLRLWAGKVKAASARARRSQGLTR